MADKRDLIIKVVGDDSDLRKTLSGIGPIAKKGLGVAIKATAAVGAGFVAASGAALKFSGELEQNLGGAKAVFGDFADEIEQKAEKAFKNMGLSTSDYLATANKMGSLFKGAGFEVEESVNITTKAMQRAADVASIMGIDTTWAMESIAGAAKGNFTMMDNLGVAMNDTTLNAYALEQGLGKTTAQMTNQEKIGLAMEMFLERTAYAAGNYARENETLAGALGTAKAALQNFMSGTGSVTDLQDSLKNASEVVVKNLKTLAPQLAKGVVEVVRGLAPVIPDIIIELLPGILDTVKVLFQEALNMLPEFVSQVATAIGDAVPAFQPLADIIIFLANNLDILTAALKAGTAAFITYKTAALAVNAIVTLKTMYGILTGAIVTADAAQKALNVSVLANPYVLAAAAIVGLVVAVASFTSQHKSAAEELQESIDGVRQSYEDEIKTIDDAQASQAEEATKVEFLKNRLYDLEQQLKSGTLTKEEAKIVQDNFNRSAGELNDIIPGIIDSLYNENGAISIQKDKVDQLASSYIELAKAKAQANALEQKLTAAYNAKYDAKKLFDEAIANHQTEYDYLKSIGYSDKVLSDKDAKHLVKERAAIDNAQSLVEKADSDIDYWAKLAGEVQNKITALSKDAVEKIEKDQKKVTNTGISNANKQADASNKAYEKELQDMKSYRDMGLITDAEYYAWLTKYRDAYFEQGSEEWQEHTTEIADYYASAMQEVSDQQKKCLEDMKEERDNFAESLRSYDTLFEETQNPFYDDSGNVAFYTDDVKLKNFDEQTKQIEHFGENLQKLKDKVDIPKELFQEIQNMSRDDGIKLTDELLSLSDDDLQKWIDSYSGMIEASNEIAGELYQDEFSEVREKFSQVWDDIPEEFYTLGVESADEFSEALTKQLSKKISALRASVMSSFSGLTNGISATSDQQVQTVGNTYITNVNMLDTPEETTGQKIRAAEDYSAIQGQRGGY